MQASSSGQLSHNSQFISGHESVKEEGWCRLEHPLLLATLLDRHKLDSRSEQFTVNPIKTESITYDAVGGTKKNAEEDEERKGSCFTQIRNLEAEAHPPFEPFDTSGAGEGLGEGDMEDDEQKVDIKPEIVIKEEEIVLEPVEDKEQGGDMIVVDGDPMEIIQPAFQPTSDPLDIDTPSLLSKTSNAEPPHGTLPEQLLKNGCDQEKKNMDYSKEGCRFYIFTRWKLGKKATEIRGELLQVYPDTTPSLETVSRWIRAFTAGKTELKDEQRSGRPRTSVTEATTVRARSIIDEDPTVTLRFLALELDISYGSAYDIVHEQLHLRKKCCRWIPHLLTDEQKAERVRICRVWLAEFEPNGPKRFSDVVTGDECWISFFTTRDKQSNMVWLADEDPRPQILKEGFRSRKRLFTIFFNSQGPICVDVMPEKSTITAQYYTDQVLPQVLEHKANTAPTRRRSHLLLHHDNAAPHKAYLTMQYLEQQGITLLPHPPYSPDLAPFAFWLFPKIKSAIAGKQFHCIQDLARTVNSELRSIPSSEYHACFMKWRKRMERCIEVGGEYFEGM